MTDTITLPKNLMKYTMAIKMEGVLILEARTTCTMAYDIITQFINTYMPAERGREVIVPRFLDRLLTASLGDEFSETYKAVGGAVIEYTITKID